MVSVVQLKGQSRTELAEFLNIFEDLDGQIVEIRLNKISVHIKMLSSAKDDVTKKK